MVDSTADRLGALVPTSRARLLIVGLGVDWTAADRPLLGATGRFTVRGAELPSVDRSTARAADREGTTTRPELELEFVAPLSLREASICGRELRSRSRAGVTTWLARELADDGRLVSVAEEAMRERDEGGRPSERGEASEESERDVVRAVEGRPLATEFCRIISERISLRCAGVWRSGRPFREPFESPRSAIVRDGRSSVEFVTVSRDGPSRNPRRAGF